MFWLYFILIVLTLLDIIAIYSTIKFNKEFRVNRGDIHMISDALYIMQKLGKALLILEGVVAAVLFCICYMAGASM